MTLRPMAGLAIAGIENPATRARLTPGTSSTFICAGRTGVKRPSKPWSPTETTMRTKNVTQAVSSAGCTVPRRRH